jgi:hypothetical protein
MKLRAVKEIRLGIGLRNLIFSDLTMEAGGNFVAGDLASCLKEIAPEVFPFIPRNALLLLPLRTGLLCWILKNPLWNWTRNWLI